MNSFDLLGLPIQYDLDLQMLESRYRILSQQLHPDRQGSLLAEQRTKMLLQAAELNQAYKTLRDEDKRAELLLRLQGIAWSEESVKMPPSFLMQMLDLQDELQDAKHEKNKPALLAQQQQIEMMSNQVRQEISDSFHKQKPPEILLELMGKSKFYKRLKQEIAQTLEDLE